MTTKICDVFIVRPDATNAPVGYSRVCGPLNCSYRASTGSLQDLIPTTLAAWCAHLSKKNLPCLEHAPACVTSTSRALLERHWRMMVTKTFKKEPPQPVEDVVPELNIDRFLSTSYRRTMTDPNILMPDIWLVPKSSEAEQFVLDCVEAEKQQQRRVQGSEGRNRSAASALVSSVRRVIAIKEQERQQQQQQQQQQQDDTFNLSGDPDVSIISSSLSPSRFGAPRVSPARSNASAAAVDDDGDDHGAAADNTTTNITPERVARNFDKSLQDFVDRRTFLFNAVLSPDSEPGAGGARGSSSERSGSACSPAELTGYVHWSDLLQNRSATGGGGSSVRSLRSFHGDKASLSETLGAAWEAAAEAEAMALSAYKKSVAHRKSHLEAQAAAARCEAAEAEQREETAKKQVDSITIKKAQLASKQERLEKVQEEVKTLELRIEAERSSQAELTAEETKHLVTASKVQQDRNEHDDSSSSVSHHQQFVPRSEQTPNSTNDRALPGEGRASVFSGMSPAEKQQMRRPHRASVIDNVGGFEHHRTNTPPPPAAASRHQKQQQQHHHNASPLLDHVRGLGSGTAMEAAMSLLSPNTAASVEGALTGQHVGGGGGGGGNSRGGSEQHHQDEYHIPLPKRGEDMSSYVEQMLRGIPGNRADQEEQHHDRIGQLRARMGLPPLPRYDGDYDDDQSSRHETTEAKLYLTARSGGGGGGGGGALDETDLHIGTAGGAHYSSSPPPASHLAIAALAQSQQDQQQQVQQQQQLHPTASYPPSVSASLHRSAADDSALIEHGALAAVAEYQHQQQQQQHHNQQQGGGPGGDLRVPLRLLASDLDAYLSRVDYEGDGEGINNNDGSSPPLDVISAMERQRVQLHQTSDPNYFGEDVEARQRLAQRVQELKHSLRPRTPPRRS